MTNPSASLSEGFYFIKKNEREKIVDTRQLKLNADYQAVLNKIYGGEISLRDKFLNSHAVVNHHCKNCMKNFFAKPLWLVNKRQLHECHTAMTSRVEKPKKATATVNKKGDSTPNKVNETMRLEMIQLYKEGNSLKSISRQFSVTPPTVKRHVQQKVS